MKDEYSHKSQGPKKMDRDRMSRDPEYRREMMSRKLRSMADRVDSGGGDVEGEAEGAASAKPCACKDGKPCPQGKAGDEITECAAGKDCAAETHVGDKEDMEPPEPASVFDDVQRALDAARAAHERPGA